MYNQEMTEIFYLFDFRISILGQIKNVGMYKLGSISSIYDTSLKYVWLKNLAIVNMFDIEKQIRPSLHFFKRIFLVAMFYIILIYVV